MRSFLCMILFLFLSCCEEKAELPLTPENTGLLVAEAVLTNESKNHLVKLSLPYQAQNGKPIPASGASVRLNEDETLYVLNESPVGSGNYYTPNIRAVTGKVYTLHIQYQGKTYSAEDSPVPVQPLRELKYILNGSGYELTPEPEGEDPNYIEHIITWKNTTACVAGDACEEKVVFYDLKTIDVNELFKPEKEPFYFPKQTTVVRKKYSVSAAYRTFLRSMLSETQWRGGVFDIQRADVPTNLSEGAIGFFAVCSVVSDSTVVQ